MIFEMRTYTATPGKLPLLIERFAKVTLAIFERHGIEYDHFWTTLIGDSNHKLVYILKWKSLAEREEKWGAFQTDPEWVQKRTESELNGAIVQNIENTIYTPAPIHR